MFHKQSRRQKTILITVIVLLITILVSFIAFRSLSDDSQPNVEQSGINYGPPTDTEESAGDSVKDSLVRSSNNPTEEPASSGTQGTTKNVDVLITDAGQYDNVIEVRAFMPSHYQDGTCIATLTKGSHKVQKSTPAYRDTSTTICTNPEFNRSEFPEAGDWQVTVSFQAEGATGTSQAKTITLK